MVNKMDYKASMNAPDPVVPSQIPDVRIDYRGLVKYAHSVGKEVSDLSDAEKEAFIQGGTMEEIREKIAEY